MSIAYTFLQYLENYTININFTWITLPPQPAKASTTTKFLQIKAVYLANSSGVTEYQPSLNV